MRGFLFGRWKLGEGVVVLRFLWGFRTPFLKRFVGLFGCVGVRKVSDVFWVVLRCQKGQGGSLAGELYPCHEKQTKKSGRKDWKQI